MTLEDIEANIIGEYYFSAADGARFGWLTSDHANVGVRGRVRSIADSIPTSSHASVSASIDTNAGIHPALGRMTFCVLVLRNGFAVTGESSCVNPETFNIEVGRKVARENAISQLGRSWVTSLAPNSEVRISSYLHYPCDAKLLASHGKQTKTTERKTS